jgi:hypothetical protein
MSYILRLFENGKEVNTSTVKKMIGATNYPEVGQTIEGTWKVIGVILHTATELHLHVERIK